MRRRYELQYRNLRNPYFRGWSVCAKSNHSASKVVANYKSSYKNKNILEDNKADGWEFRIVTFEVVETPVACEEV